MPGSQFFRRISEQALPQVGYTNQNLALMLLCIVDAERKMVMKTYHVAIAGATGAVGTEFLNLLESREFPLASLRLLASERSAGRSLPYRGRPHLVSSS